MYDGSQSPVLCAALCGEENDCDVEKRALNCLDISCSRVEAGAMSYDCPNIESCCSTRSPEVGSGCCVM